MQQTLLKQDETNNTSQIDSKQELDASYVKRKTYLDFLKKTNEYLKNLIDRLYSIVSEGENTFDNRPVTEYQKSLKDAVIHFIRGFADIYGVDKDPFLQEKYFAFIGNVLGYLKILVSFLYSNRFKDRERTRKAVQWYWDSVKHDVAQLGIEISNYYGQQVVQVKEESLPKVRKKRKQKLDQFSIFDSTKEEKPDATDEKPYTISITAPTGGQKTRYQRNIAAIKLLKQIEQEGRQATEDEKLILTGFSGWGAIPQVFGTAGDEWNSERQELKDLLTPEEYSGAKSSTLSAYYTSPEIATFMYNVLERLGFSGGNVLEPALGTGNFFGTYPANWLECSKLTGIELDSLTGRIAKLLYPHADIRIQGYEDCVLSKDNFDLVISNVPFGDYRVFDRKYNHLKLNIHDYYFAKTLDMVCAGGVVAFITSKFTMDKQSDFFRQYIAARANFLGAVRLPNTAFKKNAGTEVTADILFLQKKDPDSTDISHNWLNVAKNSDGIDLNEYYVDHPEMLMGKMAVWKRMFGSENTTLMEDKTRPLAEMLQEAVDRFPQGVYTPKVIIQKQNDEVLPADPSVKNYAYTLVDGRVYQREDSIMKPVRLRGKKLDRMKDMIGVRDALRSVISVQVQDMPESYVKAEQASLNKVYDDFVKAYGYLSDKVNKDLFREDPESALLLSLEIINKDGQIKKADIFHKRTINPTKKITKADNAHEALAVSLNETGDVDLGLISSLTGKTEDEVIDELKGRIFLNPQTKKWEISESYLSGNITLKLQIAEIAVEHLDDGAKYLPNVEALKKAMPEKLKPEEIEVKLGAVWLPPEDIRDFVAYILEVDANEVKNKVKVEYSKNIATWAVDADVGKSVQNTKTWGTDRMNAVDIVEHTLNLSQVSVYDYDGDGKPLLNKKETIAARAKQDAIKQAFARWIFDEPQRRNRLTELYNEKFNNLRLRTYNGDYLTLSVINSNIQLRKHQKDAIARIVNSDNTLLAHVVGSGKTFTLIAAAMELKRLGLISKPMFVVPNSLTGQWAGEFLRLYPWANILVCEKKDFEKENRKRFISRIASCEWDGVIIAHSQFTKIPISQQYVQDAIVGQLSEVVGAMEALRKDNKASNRLVKQLERVKKNLEENTKEIYNWATKDNTICFDELGVDQIFVDEADEFKNTGVITKMRNIAGIGTTRSQKAFDMHIKVKYLTEKNGGRGVVFATGTPITNSMSEMYVMTKYLAPHLLEERGLSCFDAWASTFAEITSSMEITPDGSGYRIKQRFSKFYNLPELLTIFRSFTDIQTQDMVKLPIPELVGGKAIIECVEASQELKEFVESLVERSEKIRNNEVSPSSDNMLLVTNEGRKAALDLRLIDPLAPDYSGSKVNKCVENVYKIWNNTQSERLTQLIFSDLSTPKVQGFDVYNDIKRKLVDMGIPSEEITFIHEADTEDKKLKLFNKVRNGIVRILIGSTSKMGAGCNLQDRLVALHHLEAPWRPRDVSQREGRILRQGNMNKEVMIFRYVTKSSFDSYIWQILETKSRFINQVMSGKTTVRAAEDIDGTTLSYAEVKAIASGNPLVLEKMQTDTEVQRLQSLRSSYLSNKYRMQDEIADISLHKKTWSEQINNYRMDLTQRQEAGGNSFVMQINGKTYTDRKEAGKEIISLADTFRITAATAKVDEGVEQEIGSYAGFKMYVYYKRKFFEDSNYCVVLKGKERYTADVTVIPSIMLDRLEQVAFGIEAMLDKKVDALERIKRQENGLQVELGKPFDKELELNRLLARQQELNSLLGRGKATELLDEGAEAV